MFFFFFLQGLAQPWFGSTGPLVPWSSVSWCFGPLVLVPCSWSPGPLVPWLLGFSGFLASRLRWRLGFSGLKQLHLQDGYMSLSPNSTCHFAEDLN